MVLMDKEVQPPWTESEDSSMSRCHLGEGRDLVLPLEMGTAITTIMITTIIIKMIFTRYQLHSLHMLIPFILTPSLYSGCSYYHTFTEEETEAQGVE